MADELAIYLNGLPDDNRPEGSQSLIVPGSLDFINDMMAAPTLTTTPDPTNITLSDSSPPVLKDTAELLGGIEPTGTITFTLQGSTLVYTEVVTVNGNGSYTTPVGYCRTPGRDRHLPVERHLQRRRQQRLGQRGGQPRRARHGRPASLEISTVPNIDDVGLRRRWSSRTRPS